MILYLIVSTQAHAASLKAGIGAGIQYGGIPGLQGSLDVSANKFRIGLGYAGFALGYDRFLSSNTSLGLQTFANQYIAGIGLSLNYYLNSQTSSGWLIGLDLYRAVDTAEFTLDFYEQLFLNSDDFELETDVDNGVLFSVGYQF